MEALAQELEEIIDDIQDKVSSARANYDYLSAAIHAARLADATHLRALVIQLTPSD